MMPDELYEDRQNAWRRLSELLDSAGHDLSRLSSEDVNELSRLYRATAADLALARRDFPNHQVTDYLNRLVARGHAVVYQGQPLAFDRILHFLNAGFPRTFRRSLPFFLVSTALFLLPAILVGLATGWDPEASSRLLPPQVQQLLPLIEEQELWTHIPVEQRPYASAFIMRNNIQVIFLAFSGGVLFGLLTLYILVTNGLLIGGLTGLTAHYGVGFELWTFVIGHGVIELTVVFMAGGAGLALGWSIIHPGLLRRRDALTLAARSAVRLIVGAVPLLVIAGLIEGFLSPNEAIPWQVKWIVGLGSGILLYAYLFLAGRR